jgi:hypothetical protein
MASTELRVFFDSLSSRDSLRRLIAEKISESLYLEFKTKKDRSKPDLDQSDAWQFSRALAGFANSDGGILIWGIETNKHEQAAKLKPIDGVLDFTDRLKKSLLNSTQPVVDGVILETIPASGSADEGFVKCLIPVSDKTPHRAMLADREYFKRTAEGFYRLEHFDLEDMVGRRPQPSLSLHLDLTPRPGDDPHEELHFSIINSGRGVAKYVGFICSFEPEVKVADVRGHLVDVTSLNRGAPIVSYQDNAGVVHPNGIAASAGHAILQRPGKGGRLTVRLRWYCENMQVRTAIAEVSPSASTSAA